MRLALIFLFIVISLLVTGQEKNQIPIEFIGKWKLMKAEVLMPDKSMHLYYETKELKPNSEFIKTTVYSCEHDKLEVGTYILNDTFPDNYVRVYGKARFKVNKKKRNFIKLRGYKMTSFEDNCPDFEYIKESIYFFAMHYLEDAVLIENSPACKKYYYKVKE